MSVEQGVDRRIQQFEVSLVEQVKQLAREVAVQMEKGAVAASIKSDNSVVTEIDYRIDSALKKFTNAQFSPAHFLGEESANEAFSEDVAKHKVAYQRYFDSAYGVVVDAVDGTQNLSLGYPIYGVSVGITQKSADGHHLKGGVVALPALNKVYFTLNGKSFVSDLNGGAQVELRYSELARPVFTAQDVFFERYSFKGQESLRMFGCLVTDILDIAAGRSVGTVMDFGYWDFAGALAIAETMGVRMYDIRTGQERRSLNADDFDLGVERRNWCLNGDYLICRPENKERLLATIIPR